MSILSPCPFCGSIEVRLRLRTDGSVPAAGARVRCLADGCGVSGPIRSHEDDAIDAWNATVSRDGPDAFEHWTCGTAHIRAERTLQLIELTGAADLPAMEMLAGLVDEAGIANARRALDDSDVPF